MKGGGIKMRDTLRYQKEHIMSTEKTTTRETTTEVKNPTPLNDRSSRETKTTTTTETKVEPRREIIEETTVEEEEE